VLNNRVKSSDVILGIDPGSQFLGYGALREDRGEPELVEWGVVEVPRDLDFSSKLLFLAEKLSVIIDRLAPVEVAVERVFLGKNADSAFKLGHVRGICLMEARRAGCEVVEFAARSVKKMVTGHGGADKEQVALIMQGLFKAEKPMRSDASDALALAYCQWMMRQSQMRLQQMEGKL